MPASICMIIDQYMNNKTNHKMKCNPKNAKRLAWPKNLQHNKREGNNKQGWSPLGQNLSNRNNFSFHLCAFGLLSAVGNIGTTSVLLNKILASSWMLTWGDWPNIMIALAGGCHNLGQPFSFLINKVRESSFYWSKDGGRSQLLFLESWSHLRGFFDDTVMWWVGGFCHPGECLRGHWPEALVSRVWIFTPRHDSHTFGANLRHRHRHTCHRHLRSSWWERHCKRKCDEDLEKVEGGDDKFDKLPFLLW